MIDSLRRVCELQPNYSSENTPAMAARGRIIRQELPAELRLMADQFVPALMEFGGDFAVEGSDGIGRKTEAPWVRIYSREMSPSAREGYYLVVHFAADGSAVFITLGCGSTIWTGGDLQHLPPEELLRRTNWARNVVRIDHPEREGPFVDEIRIGSRARLPQTFERATALAKRVGVDELDEDEFRDLLLAAIDRLAVIYRAQRQGRDLLAAQQVEALIEEVVAPVRAGGHRQGFGLSAKDRRIVELHAMALARRQLESEGFHVEDRSATHPFDFQATRGVEQLKIEVKGTTGANCDAILMTHREVALHQDQQGMTGLITVADIRLVGAGEDRAAEGGVVEALIPWDVRDWVVQPIAFKVTRR